MGWRAVLGRFFMTSDYCYPALAIDAVPFDMTPRPAEKVYLGVFQGRKDSPWGKETVDDAELAWHFIFLS